MRNFLNYLPFFVFFLFIVSCQKDGILEIQEEQFEKELSLKVITDEGTIVNQRDLKIETFPRSQEVSTLREKSQTMVSGHLFTATSNSLFSFTAVENRGGFHGQIEINSPTLGQVHGKVLQNCTGGDNEGGIVFLVTEVKDGDTWGLNDVVYWYVKDNGEGNNTPKDQYQSTITWYPYENWLPFYDSPEELIADYPCGIVGYTGNYVDIAKGQVQVKN